MPQRLLPAEEPVSPPDRSDRECAIDDEDAEAVLDALSSDRTREIFRTLCSSPMTTAEVAEAAETSIQNATYHLEKLERTGLIDVVETWYSSRGKEMAVYAATPRRIVVDCETPVGARDVGKDCID